MGSQKIFFICSFVGSHIVLSGNARYLPATYRTSRHLSLRLLPWPTSTWFWMFKLGWTVKVDFVLKTRRNGIEWLSVKLLHFHPCSKAATYQGSGLGSPHFPFFPGKAIHRGMFRDLSNAHEGKNVATQTRTWTLAVLNWCLFIATFSQHWSLCYIFPNMN